MLLAATEKQDDQSFQNILKKNITWVHPMDEDLKSLLFSKLDISFTKKERDLLIEIEGLANRLTAAEAKVTKLISNNNNVVKEMREMRQRLSLLEKVKN